MSTGEMRYEEEYHEVRHAYLLRDAAFVAHATWANLKLFGGHRDPGRVLEFGCGLGQNIFLLKDRIGFDISKFAIERCRARAIPATTELSDLAIGSFDFVVSSHNLEHLPDPLENLRLLRGFMRPGGKLLLVLPVEIERGDWTSPDLDQHLYAWTSKTIGNLLRRAGLRVEFFRRSNIGSGVERLLPIARVSQRGYWSLTRALGALRGRPLEMVVQAGIAD